MASGLPFETWELVCSNRAHNLTIVSCLGSVLQSGKASSPVSLCVKRVGTMAGGRLLRCYLLPSPGSLQRAAGHSWGLGGSGRGPFLTHDLEGGQRLWSWEVGEQAPPCSRERRGNFPEDLGSPGLRKQEPPGPRAPLQLLERLARKEGARRREFPQSLARWEVGGRGAGEPEEVLSSRFRPQYLLLYNGSRFPAPVAGVGG